MSAEYRKLAVLPAGLSAGACRKLTQWPETAEWQVFCGTIPANNDTKPANHEYQHTDHQGAGSAPGSAFAGAGAGTASRRTAPSAVGPRPRGRFAHGVPAGPRGRQCARTARRSQPRRRSSAPRRGRQRAVLLAGRHADDPESRRLHQELRTNMRRSSTCCWVWWPSAARRRTC